MFQSEDTKAVTAAGGAIYGDEIQDLNRASCCFDGSGRKADFCCYSQSLLIYFLCYFCNENLMLLAEDFRPKASTKIFSEQFLEILY